MNLSCTKACVIKCEYYDLEKLIFEVYNSEYKIMPMEEVGSSQYAATYDVDVAKAVLSEDELDQLDSFRNGKPEQFMLNVILTDMCNSDHLEADEYIISVTW